ncbi:MAG: L-threonylcarbamoyladenylate synthase [Planctomycetota bacterium]|nr:L-threonylcarbamoyladenylate synthase [Planctomycetota bacterium]
MITEEQFTEAASLLRGGELVAFPTETVYGLAANALNSEAVARIFEVKGRPSFDPLIVHIASAADLRTWVEEVPESIQKIVDQFWPGPISVVLPKRATIPDIVTSGSPTVAIRCPGHSAARRLINLAGVPIAAPSANRFGCISPTTAQHVRDQLGDAVTCVLDDGPCQVGVESTVVGYEADRVTIYRPGGITREAIEALVGKTFLAGTDDQSPNSPGQLTKHYAPRTPLVISSDPISKMPDERIGLLTLCETSEKDTVSPYSKVEFLSSGGSLTEAATNLFAAMRRLDAAELDRIIARPVPESGLGLAIMDRLRRASAR